MSGTQSLIGLLRETAEESDGLVELRPGLSDARMDTWAAPVPEEIRVLLRAVGGIRIAFGRSRTDGGYLFTDIDFDEPLNEGKAPGGGDGSWYVERAGGPGTHHFVHLDSAGGFVYVDVDRETGAWGPVFTFSDENDTQRLAESPHAWIRRTAESLRDAVREADADVRRFSSAFEDGWREPEESGPDVLPVSAADARTSTDPVIRSVAAALPDDGALVDLRDVTGCAQVIFQFPEECRFGRAHGGTVITAVPLPYEA
ncbi:hypothetical protein [Streptomyces niveus]|uniref:hypothetical protein n=1 Tax=Streptomyces niveus TaxID=193462 RepID=UPI0003C5A61A|nr:hypothetical protein [Streptomyces niveus]EST24662.1 hypothetical protein M877_24840 [Streptomyces niveus NCIMB 11891]